MQNRTAMIIKGKITEMVVRRGEDATRMWNIATGYSIFTPPEQGIANLESLVKIIRADLVDEASQLIDDIREILKNLP